MIVIFDLDDTLFDTTGQLDETYNNLGTIVPFPDTLDVLEKIHATKILVSRGDKKTQQEKIKLLGIKRYFSEVFLCSLPEEKKEFFSAILKKYNTAANDVWVVGDRIDVEIRYGNMLGMHTVHFHHGKHKDLKPQDSFDKPMHTIKKLSELCRLIPCKQ